MAIIAKKFIHSCYGQNLSDGGDVVLACEEHYFDDGQVKTVLVPYKNPKRKFWVTQKRYRTYTEKREIESIDHLDEYHVYNHEMPREIFKALNGYYPKGYIDPRSVMESPYIFGADIDIQTILKNELRMAFDKAHVTPRLSSSGFFDIERSVVPSTMDTINLISVTHENKVYTAIHDLFFYKWVDGKKIKGDLDELRVFSEQTLTPLIDKMFAENKNLQMFKDQLPFEFHYFIGKDEIAIIKWIFEQIHRNRTHFLGVWNMDYDIPAVIDALKKGGVDPKDVFCLPGLPEDYKICVYKKDTRRVDHPVDKWSWFHTASCTQFYDAMCLYGKLRTVHGKESSYRLNDVLVKNNIEGKLHFDELTELQNLSQVDWHRHMQTYEFYRYIVYNQADVVWIQLMEWLNRDVNSLIVTCNTSHLSKFPRQTRKFADTMFIDGLKRNYILGVAGRDMKTNYDHEIDAVGGAVLDPNRMDRTGLKCLMEYPSLATYLYMYCNDVDFSGMYPNTSQAANISKETKLSTALYIYAEHVQNYHSPRDAVEALFSYLACPQDNALRIAQEFFNLPGFVEMDTLFREEYLI